ncbi:MAG: HAMP domain-containing sensor histidine kinase [Ferruginibacter sp.]
MKLLAKYNRINILVTISVVFISSICFYFMIRHVLIQQLDEDLKVEQEEIINFVRINHKLPDPYKLEDKQIEFIEAREKSDMKKFNSILLKNKAGIEEELFRQFAFTISADRKAFIVYVRKSQEETEDLIKMIALITLGIVALLLFALFLINRFLLSRLWKPFNNTLAQLKHFNLSTKNELKLVQTSTKEFIELNKTVLLMIERVKQDYEALKNFTDNASHEMQTPLAIINSKLDVLIQDENLNAFQMQQLQGVYDALDRLSNLNQSLLLLTKIENNQFNEHENISLDELIIEKLIQFEEMSADTKLFIHTDIKPVDISGNKQLIDILIANLLNNAIRYNMPGGDITVKLDDDILSIFNSSPLPALDEEQVFKRFYRHANTKPDGNGLGLSIVKQICTIAGYYIEYSYFNDRHQFDIVFTPI